MLRYFIIVLFCCSVFGSDGETTALDTSSNRPTLPSEKTTSKVTFIEDDDQESPLRSSHQAIEPQSILKKTLLWKKRSDSLNPQPPIKNIFHFDEKKKERLAFTQQLFNWCEEQNVEVTQKLKMEIMRHVEPLSDEDFLFLDHLNTFDIPTLFRLLIEPRHLDFIRHISVKNPSLVEAHTNLLFICRNFDCNSHGIWDHLTKITQQDFEIFKHNVQRTKQKVLATAHSFVAEAQLTRDDAIRITTLLLTNPNLSDYRIYDLAVPVVKRVSWIQSWLMIGHQDHLHDLVFNN